MINKRQRILAVSILAALATMAGPAAQANDDIKFKGGGFGTLGATRTNLDDTEFRTSLNQAKGADRDIDLGVDSRLGLQGTVSYKSMFSVTAQLLGMRRDANDFEVDFEWLYAQFNGVPGLDVKLGRVALPSFMVSDSRFVGYANTWLRVPPLVYTGQSFSTVDGGQLGYSHSFGPAVASVQLTHGRTKIDTYIKVDGAAYGMPGVIIPLELRATEPSVTSLNGKLEWGDWTVRIGQVKGEVEFSGGRPAFDDTFTGYGFQYDNGTWLAMGELVKRTTSDNSADSDAWYLGGGYRINQFTPYVMFSRFSPEAGTTGKSSKSTAVGLRYDFASNLALKAEYARTDSNSFFTFTDSVSPAVADKKVNVVSVALDFIF